MLLIVRLYLQNVKFYKHFVTNYLCMKSRLKELRARNNLTQEDLAIALDVSRQTIIAIERERYDPSLSLAFKMAKFFKLRIDELFYE